jgi:uridylate kinase
MMKIVFALGGSVVVPDKVDEKYVDDFAKFALDLSKNHKLAIVVGGGKTARRAIEKARKSGENEAACDYAGIDASRYNASLLSQNMGIEPMIPETIKNAKQVFETEGIVLMGGTEPGHSTDAVAAILAEYIDADLYIKLSNIDGVYDSDPKENPGAKRLEKIKIDDLTDIVNSLSQDAGNYRLFDFLAVKMLKRSGIKSLVLEGHDLKNIKSAIESKKFVGTELIQ